MILNIITHLTVSLTHGFFMHPSAIYRQLELAQAALGHATYFLEIGADCYAAQHLEFAKQRLLQISNGLEGDRSAIPIA
jgi:hypothetical protein